MHCATASWRSPPSQSSIYDAGVAVCCCAHGCPLLAGWPADAARIGAGQTLLVLGAAGGVGAVQIAKIIGARVIAAAAGQVRRGRTGGNGAVNAARRRLLQFAPLYAPLCTVERWHARTGVGWSVLVWPAYRIHT